MFLRVLSSVAGSVAAAVPTAVVATVRSLPWARHLPEAIAHAYRVVHETPRIGPNLKIACYVAMVPGTLVVPPVIVVAAAGYGLVGGMIDTFMDILDKNQRDLSKGWGPIRTIRRMHDAGKMFVESLMPQLRDYTPPELKESDAVYEISPFQAVKAVVSALGGTVLEAPGMFLIWLRHTPRILWELLRLIWSRKGRDFVDFLPTDVLLRVFATLLLFAAYGVVLCLVPFVCVMGSLGVHVYRGYTDGLRVAWSAMLTDFHKVNGLLSKAFRDDDNGFSSTSQNAPATQPST